MLQHHLMSIDILHDRLRVHGFLRCDNDQSVMRAMEKIIDVAEQAARELQIRLFPMAMDTKLSPRGTKLVREAVLRYIPEAAETFRTSRKTRFHLVVWVWEPSKNPDDEKLMALH